MISSLFGRSVEQAPAPAPEPAYQIDPPVDDVDDDGAEPIIEEDESTKELSVLAVVDVDVDVDENNPPAPSPVVPADGDDDVVSGSAAGGEDEENSAPPESEFAVEEMIKPNSNPATEEKKAPAPVAVGAGAAGGGAPDPEEKTTVPKVKVGIGLSKIRTKDGSNTTKVQRFSDHGEYGFYQGQLRPLDTDNSSSSSSSSGMNEKQQQQRHGLGKMTYDSGNSYSGPFSNDKFHGPRGTYAWHDGDEQEGSWKEGERHGTSVFRSAADGAAEYCAYENGAAVGEGVSWNARRTEAYELVDGKKKKGGGRISLELAGEIAREKFDLPVPAPSEVVVSPSADAATEEEEEAADHPPPSGKEIGILGRLFPSQRAGGDGTTLRFEDHGEWGSYAGDVDAAGKRSGRGEMTYDGGASYRGGFVNDEFHCEKGGVYRWSDGDEYEGSWKDGERHGAGVFRSASDGSVDVSEYEAGSHKGEGVWWSADRKAARRMADGDKKDEISSGLAEKLARDKFGLSVPEPSAVPQSSSSSSRSAPAPTASKSVGFIGRLFSKRKVGTDGALHFKDNGEWGAYSGSVDAAGNRQGHGTMTYETGNRYEGGFANDKFECDEGGVYRWSDDDEYDGAWKDGERHGTGIFRCADGAVEYSTYDNGVHVGEGVWWSADRQTAHKTLADEKKDEISLGMAELIARDTFGLPVPEPSKVPSTSSASEPKAAPTMAPGAAVKPTGFLGRLFPTRKVGPNGELLFKDNGEWGSYIGDFDAQGKRHGQGKMTYDGGSYYEGSFANDKFHADKGLYHWSDGDEYEGSWHEGEREGIGIFRTADGGVEYSKYDKGAHVGDGLAWSADRKTAHKIMDGTKKSEISSGMAEKLAKDMFDLPVPEPSTTDSPSESSAPATSKNVGFIGRLFSTRKVDSDGKLLFKDYGELGSYEGDLDPDEKRQGKGKMTYGSGNYYEGGFVDDKFNCEKGVYHWSDGDEYEGSWKDGERNGAGIFRSKDGTVEYSMYENGEAKGNGVLWSADRETAHALTDGEKKMELLIEEAESLSKDNFDLPMPEVSTVALPSSKSVPKPSQSLLRRLFPKEGVVGPDGKMRFKDYGDWGSYDGEFNTPGKQRHGKGNMKYDSGNYYEGGFFDNKFHCVKGTYRWADGDEYEGQWVSGERSGRGIFRNANGAVEYSLFKLGSNVGEGVSWSADRKSAFKLIDGNQSKNSEISLALAEKFARDKFDLPVPEPSKIVSNEKQSEPKPSFLGNIFHPKGNDAVSSESVKKGPRFEDYGDIGTYDGELANGLRQGEGKMLYDSGNSYEGDFKNNKFDGSRGLYRWSDGTEYEGYWKEGAFDGIGVYRIPDVGIDYSMYKEGYATGVGLFWNADYTEAYYTLNGVKQSEATLDEAEKLAKDKFGLPAPSSKPQLGITASLFQIFQRSRVGPDGKPQFKDNGDWGSYAGVFNGSGQRHGNGKMTYVSGNYYEGGFVEDKFHCDKGVYHWSDGDEYEGAWAEGERNGIGIFRAANGSVEYSTFEKGSHVGEGLWWSPDRRKAYSLVDGDKKSEMLAEEAATIANAKFGLPVPDPSEVPSQQTSLPSPRKEIGIIGRFFTSKKVGSDGTRYFKDHGDWGSWEGDVDETGNRQGNGKMTYDSTNYYEGGFVKNKFHCDKGVYHWSDGDEYEGAWKEGERHGKGAFKTADGVEYSVYENGQPKGQGVRLSADRKTAHALTDGKTKMEMLIGEAEMFVKEKFGVCV